MAAAPIAVNIPATPILTILTTDKKSRNGIFDKPAEIVTSSAKAGTGLEIISVMILNFDTVS